MCDWTHCTFSYFPLALHPYFARVFLCPISDNFPLSLSHNSHFHLMRRHFATIIFFVLIPLLSQFVPWLDSNLVYYKYGPSH